MFAVCRVVVGPELCPALGTARQERCGSIGENPGENNKMIRGLQNMTHKQRLEKLCLFSLEKTEGRHDNSLQIFKRLFQIGREEIVFHVPWH